MSAVDIMLIGEVDVHSFREEKNYIVDVAFQQAEKPAVAEPHAAATPRRAGQPAALPVAPIARWPKAGRRAAAGGADAAATARSRCAGNGGARPSPPATETAAPVTESADAAVEKVTPATEKAAPAAEKTAAASEKHAAGGAAKARRPAETDAAASAEAPTP